jgi:hypothetical protein
MLLDIQTSDLVRQIIQESGGQWARGGANAVLTAHIHITGIEKCASQAVNHQNGHRTGCEALSYFPICIAGGDWQNKGSFLFNNVRQPFTSFCE